MNQFNKRAYNKYFLHGLGNSQTALDGIIYCTYYSDILKELNKEKIKFYGDRASIKDEITPVGKIKGEIFSEEEIEEKSGEEILNSLTKRVEEIYMQYYRFIVANDEAGIDGWYNISKSGISEVKEKVKAEIEELKRKKSLLIHENGISFSNEVHREYLHRPEGAIGIEDYKDNELKYVPTTNALWNDNIEDLLEEVERNEKVEDNREFMISGMKKNIDYRLIHWSEELYKVLINLEETSKQDKIGYTNLWFLTRLARIKNGTVPNSSYEEIKKIEEICAKFKKFRQMKAQELAKAEKER